MSFEYFHQSMPETHVIARFYERAVKTGKITENGLPEIKAVPFVEIRIQDTNDIVDRPAKEGDFIRFPYEYQIFKQEKKRSENGTPLTLFAFLDAGQIECCKYRGIFTVEELAGLDSEKASLIGLEAEQKLAEKFLAVQKNNGVISDFEKKEKEYQDKIHQLKSEIQALKSGIRKLKEKQPNE